MTAKQREQKLNRVYSESFTEEQTVEDLEYLTSKKRYGGRTTEANIRKQYRAGKIGALIRRLDSIRFYCD